MKHLSRVLRSGRPAELEVGDTRYVLTPVEQSQITCHDGEIAVHSPVQVNDLVAAWVKGEFILERIVKIQQKNCLPRFQLSTKQWVGKSKIMAKAVELPSTSR